jgi:ATP-dependent 26S proteasome regulatory subunit
MMMSLQRTSKISLFIFIAAQIVLFGQVSAMSHLQTAREYVNNVRISASGRWEGISQDPVRGCARGIARGARYVGLPSLIVASVYDVLWSDVMPNWISVPVTTFMALPLAAGAYQSVKDAPQAQQLKRKIRYIAQEINQGFADEGINLARAGEIASQGVNIARSVVNPRPVIDMTVNEIRDAIISAREFGEGQAGVIFRDASHAMGREFQNGTNAINSAMWSATPAFTSLAVTGPLLCTGAWFGGKYLLYKAMQKREPKVFRSTSEKGRWERLKNWACGYVERCPKMIYSSELEIRLNNITKATININKKINEGKANVFYRNILLEGPPGTGKTYFARNMVRSVAEATNGRMKWRETNGSALLKGGIPAIDEMFEWAEKQRGVCIFIDEADTLFGDRDKLNLNDEQVIVLNHLLNRLGDRSNKYMIIMATNRKIVFDAAMQRRIDDLIEVPLPGQDERTRVLQLYRNTILLNEKENKAEFIVSVRTCLTDEKIATIAQRSQGLSNGDLQGIITTIKSDADITDNGLLTNAIVDQVVKQYIEKNQSMNAGRVLNK